MTVEELLAAAEAQRQKIIDRRKKLETSGLPIMDLEWQFSSGMVHGAGEVVRALFALAKPATDPTS